MIQLSLSPHEAKTAIGRALKTHRLAANRTQRDVAERSGVSEATIKRIEATGSGSLEHVLMVAWSLGLERVFTEFPPPMPPSIVEIAAAPEIRRRASGRRQTRRG